MVRIGLSFDEFVDINIKPRVGALPAFQEAARTDVEQMFPMAVTQAADHLRSRGYGCRLPMLEALIQNGVVSPLNRNAWSQAHVDAAAKYFEECEIFTPYAAMCQALGCSYSEFLRPLNAAADRESAKYGRQVPADDQYFVMHRQPPRDDGPAVISFTLCDDIRERLERGEEV